MPFLTTDKRFWDDRAVTLETVSTLNGGTLDVTVYQDVYGDGFPDKQTTKSLTGGTESFELTPFVRAKRADYWMKFEATGSPTLDSAKLISGKSNTIDYTSNADWRRSASSSGFTQDDLGDHIDGAIFQRGYDYGSVTRGLVAYYPFDDDWDTNPVRDKALDNDGTNNGANYVSGQIRSAGDFNGTSDYVNCGTNIDSGFSEFTISAWVLTNSTGNFKSAVSAHTPDNGFFIHKGDGTNSDNWRTGMKNSSGVTTTLSGTSAITNTWYHLLSVWDGNEFRFYEDSVLQDSANISSYSESITELWLGASENYGEYWNGQIDEVRIYDRALSAPEIERLYNLTEPSTVTPSDTL